MEHEKNSPQKRAPSGHYWQNFLTFPAIALILLYRKFISPLKPPTCRFEPTCSGYALGALRRFGLIKGSYLTIKRLAKCHPLHPGGLDPLPSAKEQHQSCADEK